MKSIKEKRGITLIALAVTIVVLLILSAVTITFVLGEDGIINKAKEAANSINNAVANDQKELNNLSNKLIPKLEDTKGIQIRNTKVKDKFGNVVTIPKGFEVVEEEGTTVPEGIVIQDKSGNQFVWIPVGKVYKDTTKNNYSDIQLGRYTFDKTNGTSTLVQAAYTDSNPKNYEIETKLIEESQDWDYIEYATRANPDGIASNGLAGLNAIAKDLAGFVNSVKLNGGYYLARYEASYGSGSSVTDYKPLSKVSTGTPRTSSSTSLTKGMLWNYVTQIEAAKISRNMYKNDNSVGVESDLVNSYAWDTAIVYIQAMGNENYANKSDGNGTLKNTGTTGDKVCNIYDMASNCFEWSTEYTTKANNSYVDPSTRRGGNCLYMNNVVSRDGYNEDGRYINCSFRTLLYVK